MLRWSIFLILIFFASAARRRIVDVVYAGAVMTADRNLIQSAFVHTFPIQVHSTAEKDCKNIVEGMTNRGEDDFLIIVSLQPLNCSKEICRKNFAQFILPPGLNQGTSVSFACSPPSNTGNSSTSIVWKSIGLQIKKEQRENVLDDLPTAMKTNNDSKGKAIIAGFAVAGLIILGLFLMLVVSNVKHSKEIKALKKIPGSEENKKPNEPTTTSSTEKSTK